jgi:hypothetical protein
VITAIEAASRRLFRTRAANAGQKKPAMPGRFVKGSALFNLRLPVLWGRKYILDIPVETIWLIPFSLWSLQASGI